jgi:hypothetical protein
MAARCTASGTRPFKNSFFQSISTGRCGLRRSTGHFLPNREPMLPNSRFAGHPNFPPQNAKGIIENQGDAEVDRRGLAAEFFFVVAKNIKVPGKRTAQRGTAR